LLCLQHQVLHVAQLVVGALRPAPVVLAGVSRHQSHRDHPAVAARGKKADRGGIQAAGQIAADRPTRPGAGLDRGYQCVGHRGRGLNQRHDRLGGLPPAHRTTWPVGAGEQVAVLGKDLHAAPWAPVGHRVGQVGVDQAARQPLLVDRGCGQTGQHISPIRSHRHIP
jgi:hypothetical protein